MYQATVTNAHCFIDRGKNTDERLYWDYTYNKFCEGYCEFVFIFDFRQKIIFFNQILHKISLLLLKIFHKIPGSKLFVFDIRYHQEFATSQAIKVKFEFPQAVVAALGVTGSALVYIAPGNTNTFMKVIMILSIKETKL